jgi:predicted DNA-binding protein with PD1-like motif
MKVFREPGGIFEYRPDRELAVRLKHDSDMIESITQLARDQAIDAGSFTAIGALKRARLGYYDQRIHEYREVSIDSPHEMASCLGNVSLKDGEAFIHAHVVLADEEGNTKGGHLLEGTVFAAEVHLRPLNGPILGRKYDDITGLSLWEAE